MTLAQSHTDTPTIWDCYGWHAFTEPWMTHRCGRVPDRATPMRTFRTDTPRMPGNDFPPPLAKHIRDVPPQMGRCRHCWQTFVFQRPEAPTGLTKKCIIIRVQFTKQDDANNNKSVTTTPVLTFGKLRESLRAPGSRPMVCCRQPGDRGPTEARVYARCLPTTRLILCYGACRRCRPWIFRQISIARRRLSVGGKTNVLMQ